MTGTHLRLNKGELSSRFSGSLFCLFFFLKISQRLINLFGCVTIYVTVNFVYQEGSDKRKTLVRISEILI